MRTFQASLRGDEGFAFSPDGKSLVSRRASPAAPSLVDHFDLFQTPVARGRANLTASTPPGMPSRCSSPAAILAWLAQARPGFEADRFTSC